jgi:hypothetical protein
VNAIWAVRSMGIDPSNGREVYLNRFDSLTYVWDVKDKVIVGDAVAKLRGNFGTSFMWKGFTLGLFFSYELGGMMSTKHWPTEWKMPIFPTMLTVVCCSAVGKHPAM